MLMFLSRLKDLLAPHHDYCVKCRDHQRVSDTRVTEIKGPYGLRRSRRGICTVCGSRTSQLIAT